MFHLELQAPLDGVFIPINKVPDQVFADETLGPAFAIDPTNNTLKAPCAGKVIQIHKAKHALTIETPSGEKVLLHIGINTVTLKGSGFESCIKVGDSVEAGQDLVTFDMDFIALKGISLITVIICLAEDDSSLKLELLNKADLVKTGILVAKLSATKSAKSSKMAHSSTEALLMSESDYTIDLPTGMHARPAARIAKLAKSFSCEITVTKELKSSSLTSVISVLSLGIEKGDMITFKAVGDDSEAALTAILKELDEITKAEKAEFKLQKPMKNEVLASKVDTDPNSFSGVSASQGIAIGKVVLITHQEIDYNTESSDKEVEKKRLVDALNKASNQLLDIEQKLIEENDSSKAAIFAAHREILADPEILEESLILISSWKSAEFAWDTTVSQKADQLESLKNELIAARANDLRDVGRRVLLLLSGKSSDQNPLEQDSIVIAEDLTPSDIIQFDKKFVIGFATVCGGATSHVAILARSIGIPAVAGMSDKILELDDGQQIILDANKGSLYPDPTEEQLARAISEKKIFQEKLDDALKSAKETTYTSDKKRIKVVANIGGADEAAKATKLGAEGVGLLRTEFIFLERKVAPTESEQIEIYQNISDELQGGELVLRTLDIGGDKQLSYLPIKAEENPFLGVRGIRFCLRNEGIFREQLRAALQVVSKEPIHIMFPMVGHLKELQQAKAILEQERQKLNAPMPKVGIMVEVPSTALMADVFAPEVDFFSVGTNDLTQYTLATDRGHSELAGDVDGLNPAVLQLISLTCIAAKKHDKWVGVCGGIASDVSAVPILIGLGVSELSLSMPSIPLIKATVRKLDSKECFEVSQDCLKAKDAKEIREIISAKWPLI